MLFPPIWECRTYQFSYKSRDSLYIDHFGARVLADVDGSGSFRIECAPETASVRCDDLLATASQGEFRESLIITSKDDGLSQIIVSLGSPIDQGGPEIVTDRFEGCGWLSASDSIDLVDESPDGWADMRQVAPIPVMTSAIGSKLKVRPSSDRVSLITEVDLSDPSSLLQHCWTVKNCSKLFHLRSDRPGVGELDGQVLSHLNLATFEFDKPLGCRGILVRKLYDAFHGRQRARVLLNGRFIKWWYEPVQDRKARWRTAQIGLSVDPEPCRLSIGIDPPAGSPLWSVSKYQIFGFF